MGSGNHVYEVCKVIYYIDMKEGGRRKLVIYPEAGYGKAGAPPTIPPNSKLVFDVELLKVQ